MTARARSRRLCGAVPLLIVLAAAGCSGRPSLLRPATFTLSIVSTNDVHGGVLPADGRGGLALLAGYVNNLRAARARDGGAVLLIDAGDMWQGTLESNLTEGASVVAAYNALGYAAAAVGNHEFDYGPVGPDATAQAGAGDPRGALKARASEARFPFLAANLIDAATGEPVSWPNVESSTMVEAAGVTIGIVGVTTRETLTATIAANVRGLAIAPLADTIARQARMLQDRGAALIIVTAHAGGRCTRFEPPRDLSSCETSSEIFTVARQLPRGLVDVILAGHVHAGMAHEVGGIPITSAFSGGRAFGRIDLTVERKTGDVVSHRMFPPHDLCARANPRTGRCDPEDPAGSSAQSTYEGAAVTPDETIARILAPAAREADRTKAAPLGVFLDTPVARADALESPLGNLFTDAMREASGADVSLINVRGGLRADLPAGPLTFGSLYRATPFDNRVVTLKLTTADLERVLLAELQTKRPAVGLSGVYVRARCSSGVPDLTLRTLSGELMADDAVLTVATIDFLATGGDGILSPVMPPGGFPPGEDAALLRDVVADWLRARGGRLSAGDLLDPRKPRWTVPGDLPLTCSS